MSSKDNACSKCGGTNFNSLNRCRPCWAKYMRSWNVKNKDKVAAQNKAYKQTDGYKNSHLKHNYNMSLTEYKEISKQQNHVCAICKQPETSKHKSGKVKQLAVDHCHKTGKIRGLLCSKCNKGIGMFKDKTDLLKLAITYLER